MTRRKWKAGDRSLRIAGLFAGIGGIELGLARVGHRTIMLCERDPAARAVLEARFPQLASSRGRLPDDVTALERLPRGTDLVAAGFPCQDLSQAGRSAGIWGPKSRLVQHVFRLAESSHPEFVLLENVPQMLHLDHGRAMRYILRRLEDLGYQWAYRVIDARCFGLPQRRKRVFIVGSRHVDPRRILLAEDSTPPPEAKGPVAKGFYWTEGNTGLGWTVDGVPTLKAGSTIGVPSPPAVLLPGGRVIRIAIEDAERLQGFRRGWTRPAMRVAKHGHRWRLVGNAVAVPVAAWIGRRLREPGSEYQSSRDRRISRESPLPPAASNVGSGWHASQASCWPVRKPGPRLHEFLGERRESLSLRATRGFHRRALRAEKLGKLRMPRGFLDQIARHVSRMSRLQKA